MNKPRVHRRRSVFSRRLVCLAIAVAVALGCDDVVKDATFRTWCGENLCEWTTEQGSIRRAPTWHRRDFGVELVDTPTVLSQTSDRAPRCFEFTTVADVEASAQVTIGLDFDADGTIDHEQAVAATSFREAKTVVTAPLAYARTRFVITKRGTGRAVLAQMRVRGTEDCSAPPVALTNLPLGAPCDASSGGAECRSGICCAGMCSECCFDAAPCPGGGSCERSPWHNAPARAAEISSFVVPPMCDPARRAREGGAPCLVGEDCRSGSCSGVRAESSRIDAAAAEQSRLERIPCSGEFPDADHPDCEFTFLRAGTCR
jgi:hypothetical protein